MVKMALGQIIAANFSTLLRCLEPTNELLGKLLLTEFVQDRIPFIQQQVTLNDKTNALLTTLREVPDDFQELVMNDFIAALRSCGQEHVANIFRPESDKVPMSNEHRTILVKQSCELCKFLDPVNGILDKLFSSEVITWDDGDRIRNMVGFNDMARQLISTILRKSDDAFQVLVSSLKETGQSHVIYMLTGEGDSLPLSEDYRTKLREQRELIHSVTPHDLMPALIAKGVFTSYDQERVEGRKTNDDKAEMIFDLIARKSQTAFDQFVEILRKCKHEHVAEPLLGPEVNAEVEVSVEAPAVDRTNLEHELRQDIPQTLAGNETELKQEMTKNGISVSGVVEGSIIVKFKYKDHAALVSLQKLYSSKKFDQLFTEAFCPKFAAKGLKSLRLVIAEVEFQRHFELQLMTDDHRSALMSLAEHSFNTVTISNELLDKLSLSDRCRQVVRAPATREQQVKTLLDIVSRQPDSAFTQLLNALDDTQQTEAASYLRRCLEGTGVSEIGNTVVEDSRMF